MKTAALRRQPCPVCKRRLEAATDLTGEVAPGVGDVTVCISCAAVLIFGDGMVLRMARQPDIDALSDYQRNVIGRAVVAINQMQGQR